MNTRKDLETKLEDAAHGRSPLERSASDLQPSASDPQPSTLNAQPSARRYWRTLEELAATPAFQDVMRAEFPQQADVWPDDLSRRRFLTLMGASLALAGLGGCSVKPAPVSKIVPYVKPPRDIVPGKPLFFATTLICGGAAVGVLVESHMGRPTKIEGNPDHPASRGATGILQQASVLTLYDPDRSQTVTHLGRTRSWNDALAALRDLRDAQKQKRGGGLRILSEPVISPTLDGLRRQLLDAFPDAKWHTFEALPHDAAHRAAKLAFGEPVGLRHDFTKADVVLSLDADFLACRPAGLQDTRDFIARRRVRTPDDASGERAMNRLYVVETNVSITGSKADHRLPLRPSEIESFARGVAAELDVLPAEDGKVASNWAKAVARDLAAHRGRSLVLAGNEQPVVVHLLAHALNDRLGNIGETVLTSETVEFDQAPSIDSLKALTDDLKAGRVEALLVLGGNPVYASPADFELEAALQKAPLRIHVGLYQDETARQCHWHLPESHTLESWGDARTFDGTASLIQPLIEPLYRGRSQLEVVSFLATGLETPGDELVRSHWRNRRPQGAASSDGDDFQAFWERALHDGTIEWTAFKPRSVALRSDWQDRLKQDEGGGPRAAASRGDTFEILFQPDPTVHDGSFTNNGWLQELPKPVTKLTWDNAALMSPATAARLGVGAGKYAHGGEHGGFDVDVVELQLEGRSVRAPVWVVPGHADGAITVSLGYGRGAAGRIGGTDREPVGFNAYALRTSNHLGFAPGLTILKTGDTRLLACTQAHHLMENRAPVLAASLDEFRRRPDFAAEHTAEELKKGESAGPERLTFYKPYDYSPPIKKWGMSIDLTACVGCHACVVACQAENNIPVVGKEQVSFGREMHWLRIDRYISGTADDPGDAWFQPVPCMHCEQAPCEYVCPVAATVHSAEGLNDMVYNRCVGTRFCSNNCPYKVRRFNFLQYADETTPTIKLQYNPDVTVRSRGVMEKCTYCVQRIRAAEIGAETENRPVADGEVLTACQAACPAHAITFGDMNQPDSEVTGWKQSPLNYALLDHLNTLPRTTYLAGLRNPNPELEGA